MVTPRLLQVIWQFDRPLTYWQDGGDICDVVKDGGDGCGVVTDSGDGCGVVTDLGTLLGLVAKN